MKFCPGCNTRLRKIDGVLVCSKCDYKEDTSGIMYKDADVTIELDVLSEEDGKDILPTITIDCDKCGHNEAVWWMLQTRSADEPTTQFYRCVKCSHTWRDYS
ncbi:MAG: transcription factor S [Cenarchaeum sp. SB0665_bin_23]|nr:transcription factor S [Cenarchaeum sp. SB0667_bin_13]MXY37645.1 transcription factor S [Cenarchaeum sp. SB0664_bin_35]MXY60583.1 transcription factor S [Cenarchaeum sp. SB0665_bin_23]MXZ93038.1 transcription factor S [Cenarchaeum sp. SB0666_bin_15]MYB46465.1 transcription factor S [Cenarchaeum sp. SB0662_bin_33]MYC79968.1 transcription factor S [Cenarchaeum sp. SB0661_bin_35]MYD59346.1 transcription factor S [Cenarchaeum sp. SB0678_bin_8]MYG32678.1 transcription factor S [Cenarchaeum sp.